MLHVVDVNRAANARRLQVRRLVMPSYGVESWTLIGPDLRPVPEVDEYLAWLTHNERSPNTIEAYAFDLKVFWSYLVERGLAWTSVGVMEIGEFAAWARQPATRTAVLREEDARRSPRTVNRILTAVVGFYEFHGRRGNDLAKQLVVQTRSGWGGHRPFLAGIADGCSGRPRASSAARLRDAVEAGEAEGKHLAYLTDRVRMNEGRHQIYGTQVYGGKGGPQPWPIEDAGDVDARRAAVGLEPLADYLRTFTARH